MGFNRTQGSIASLSSKSVITADQLLDMMVCVVQDVMEYDGIKTVADIPTGDEVLLVKKHYNLADMLLTLSRKNQSGIQELSAGIQEKIKKTVNELQEIQPQISEVNRQIEESETQKSELDKQYKELYAVRGVLLEAEKKCEEIQGQIDKLSDPALDEMEQQRVGLEKELEERKATADRIEGECAVVRRETEECEERVSGLKQIMTELNGQKEDLLAEEASLLQEKEKAESENAQTRIRLAEYEIFLAELPEKNKELEASYESRKAEMTVLLNALNSVLSEEFLMDTLFRIPEMPRCLSVESYPDCDVDALEIDSPKTLGNWCESVEKRVDGLLKVYGTMLEALVKQSERMLKE